MCWKSVNIGNDILARSDSEHRKELVRYEPITYSLCSGISSGDFNGRPWTRRLYSLDRKSDYFRLPFVLAHLCQPGPSPVLRGREAKNQKRCHTISIQYWLFAATATKKSRLRYVNLIHFITRPRKLYKYERRNGRAPSFALLQLWHGKRQEIAYFSIVTTAISL